MSTILIVEDDESISDLMKTVLDGEGFRVITSPSAEGAKTLLQTEACDLAIIDIILPGQGGMDLILELHALCPNLAVILTSGKIDMNKATFKVLAHQFGVVSILPKPFTIEELLTSVHESLSGAEVNPGVVD